MPERIVIVGAGPAGIAAAGVLAAAGLRPTLIDEAAAPGGQIYRKPDPDTGFDLTEVLGADAAVYRQFHARAGSVTSAIDYRPRTSAWAIHERQVWTLHQDRIAPVTYDALLLATGATDRTLPVPGWTLPGVYTLGGAQVLLKQQGCLIGRRTVLCGSSPLLYLAAKQYLAAGGTVAAILDTTPIRHKVAAARDLLASTATLRRGLAYMAHVRLKGVPIRQGIAIAAFEGRETVTGVSYTDARGRSHRIDCDSVAFGFGLKPETQLADLAGIGFAFDATFRQWLPIADASGRAGTGHYLAGDGCTIGGAEAAEVSGTLAAAALLDDLGRKAADLDRPGLAARLARLRRFQRGLARAFALPHGGLAAVDAGTTVCRCEAVTVGDLRRALAEPLPPSDINRLKALTRVGMGRCQGRFCGHAAAEIMAAINGRPLGTQGRLRGQAPIKPLPATAREAAAP